MTTFNQELAGRYVNAGADRPSLDDHRVARAAFVRDTVRTINDADKKFGIDPADLGSLAELVDAAEEHLEHISHNVSQRSVVTPPTSKRRHRMRKPNSVLGGVALALALTLTACSDDGTDPDAQETATATPSTTAPTSATPTPQTPEDLAAVALMSYFTITEKAEKSGKLKDMVKLSEVATGDAYFNERTKVIDYNANGVRLRGTVQHELGDVVTVDSGTFVISDCEDRAKSKVVVLASGNEVPFTDPDGNPMPDRVKVDYTVVKRAKGEWVVEEADVRWREQC